MLTSPLVCWSSRSRSRSLRLGSSSGIDRRLRTLARPLPGRRVGSTADPSCSRETALLDNHAGCAPFASSCVATLAVAARRSSLPRRSSLLTSLRGVSMGAAPSAACPRGAAHRNVVGRVHGRLWERLLLPPRPEPPGRPWSVAIAYRGLLLIVVRSPCTHKCQGSGRSRVVTGRRPGNPRSGLTTRRRHGTVRRVGGAGSSLGRGEVVRSGT